MYPTQFPAPVPPPPKRRRGLIVASVIVGGILLVGAAVGITLAATSGDSAPATTTAPPTTEAPATTEPEPETVTVVYSISVGGEWCRDLENEYDDNWGYDDIPGMEFQVRDENDRIIGHGALPHFGEDTASSCDFEAEPIEVPVSELYQVGNPERGYVTWDHDEVRERRGELVLNASAEL
jgi:hypothetical protein